MGLAAGTVEGAQSLLIYLAIYVTMNVGVFAFILNMERDGKPVTDIYVARALQPASSRRGRRRWRCCCSASPGCRRWSASSGSSTC